MIQKRITVLQTITMTMTTRTTIQIIARTRTTVGMMTTMQTIQMIGRRTIIPERENDKSLRHKLKSLKCQVTNQLPMSLPVM